MNFNETTAPKISQEKISAQEADKIKTLSEKINFGKTESTTASADEKLLQRLENDKPQIETATPKIHADAEVNNGQPIEYGMMLCSDRCIKSRVHSGRCFHS